jgi:hypothetical protein
MNGVKIRIWKDIVIIVDCFMIDRFAELMIIEQNCVPLQLGRFLTTASSVMVTDEHETQCSSCN